MLAVLLGCSSMAGLQEREKEVRTRSESKKSDSDKDSDHQHDNSTYSSYGSGTYPHHQGSSSGSFMSDFWGWLVAAPFAYRSDDPASTIDGGDGTWADDSDSLFPRHEKGQHTVPTARVDYNFQWADDVDARDGRIELGYKWFGFLGRMTRYEDTTGFVLDVRQYYGVLRYGGYRPDFVPGTFEANLGVGIAHHTGDIQQDDTSAAFSLALKYYPTDWIGFEFRPAWYRWEEITIRDYDLSASIGHRYFMLRGGYRWLWDRGEVDVQSGPYAGLSVSF